MAMKDLEKTTLRSDRRHLIHSVHMVGKVIKISAMCLTVCQNLWPQGVPYYICVSFFVSFSNEILRIKWHNERITSSYHCQAYKYLYHFFFPIKLSLFFPPPLKSWILYYAFRKMTQAHVTSEESQKHHSKETHQVCQVERPDQQTQLKIWSCTENWPSLESRSRVKGGKQCSVKRWTFFLCEQMVPEGSMPLVETCCIHSAKDQQRGEQLEKTSMKEPSRQD